MTSFKVVRFVFVVAAAVAVVDVDNNFDKKRCGSIRLAVGYVATRLKTV